MACGLGLLAPVRAMREQGRAVHQEGFDMGEMTAQLVEDGKAVGVHIASEA
jgi:hypothetical protein